MKCTSKECQREQVFWLTEEESLAVERRNYILRSYEGLVAILARELAEARNPDAKEMLKLYSEQYQRAAVDLYAAQNAVIGRYLGSLPENLRFTFDFERRMLVCRWEQK